MVVKWLFICLCGERLCVRDIERALIQERVQAGIAAATRRGGEVGVQGRIGRVFDRLMHIRTVGVDQSRRNRIPQQRFDTLVEEARRVPVQHLAGNLEPDANGHFSSRPPLISKRR